MSPTYKGIIMVIEWIKPSGLHIETNTEQATIDKAVALGWVRAEDAKTDTVDSELIQSAETVEDLKVALDLAGLSIDMRGSLERLKEKALIEMANNDNSE